MKLPYAEVCPPVMAELRTRIIKLHMLMQVLFEDGFTVDALEVEDGYPSNVSFTVTHEQAGQVLRLALALTQESIIQGEPPTYAVEFKLMGPNDDYLGGFSRYNNSIDGLVAEAKVFDVVLAGMFARERFISQVRKGLKSKGFDIPVLFEIAYVG